MNIHILFKYIDLSKQATANWHIYALISIQTKIGLSHANDASLIDKRCQTDPAWRGMRWFRDSKHVSNKKKTL